MKPFLQGLDNETQLLVAAGAAVAAGCIPCLKNITSLAEAEGIEAALAEGDLTKLRINGQIVEPKPTKYRLP